MRVPQSETTHMCLTSKTKSEWHRHHGILFVEAVPICSTALHMRRKCECNDTEQDFLLLFFLLARVAFLFVFSLKKEKRHICTCAHSSRNGGNASSRDAGPSRTHSRALTSALCRQGFECVMRAAQASRFIVGRAAADACLCQNPGQNV